MSTNAIDYSKYFWQDGLVRVRRSRPDDWKQHYNHYDSECRFYTDYEQELPFDETRRQEGWENYIRSNENNKEWVCLAFETLDGEYVGAAAIFRALTSTTACSACSWARRSSATPRPRRG